MNVNLISNFLSADNPSLRNEALAYFEHLQNTPAGWQLCIETLLDSNSASLNESGVFFCLHVLENYVKSRYASESQENKNEMRRFLINWFNSNRWHSTFVLNKFAYLVNSLFLLDYPAGSWPTFFHDFLTNCRTPESCDVFLRILLQINADLADREIPRTAKENERSNIIKDMMRETHMLLPELAQFWLSIINTYRESRHQLVILCLNVIGSYVSWIDIGLITNEAMMSSLLNLFSQNALRSAVCICFNGILKKGMDPMAKTQLIEQFMNLEVLKEKFNRTSLMQEASQDLEYVINLARLFNTIGIELIECLKKVKSKTNEGVNEEMVKFFHVISQSIEAKFDILCVFLAFENLHISAQVHPFAREYIHWFKAAKISTAMDSESLDPRVMEQMVLMMNIIISQSKYPDDYDFECDEESDFDEYRRSVKVLFENLMICHAAFCIEYICNNIVEPVLLNWQASNYPASYIEVSLYFFYLIGENLNMINDTKRLEKLLQLLVASNISTFSHMSVKLIYFELVFRYEKFFTQSLDSAVPQILISFLDERGFKNPSPKIRSRVFQLFNRFIKSQIKSKRKEKTQFFAKEIIERLQEFVYTGDSKTAAAVPMNLTTDDRLIVYETISILIVTNQKYETNEKYLLLKSLLVEPLWNKFDQLFNEIASITLTSLNGPSDSMKPIENLNELERTQVSNLTREMSHLIHLVSATSKAFSNLVTMKSINGQTIYLESFERFVKAVKLRLDEENLFAIQSSLRQLLHRLIVCLEEADIVPLLPICIENILPPSNLNAKTIHEIVPLIIQIVTKFKHSWIFQRDFSPFLLQLFSSLVPAIFQFGSDETLSLEEKQALQKSYYSFLSCLATSNVMEVFTNLDVQILERILMSVVQGASEFPDIPTQKSCYIIMRKLLELHAEILQGIDKNTIMAQNGLANGLLTFIYSSVIPSCFLGPIRQCDEHHLLPEAISLLQTIQKLRGKEELCSFLQNQLFPQNFATFTRSSEFIQALASDNTKAAKEMLRAMVHHFKAKEPT